MLKFCRKTLFLMRLRQNRQNPVSDPKQIPLRYSLFDIQNSPFPPSSPAKPCKLKLTPHPNPPSVVPHSSTHIRIYSSIKGSFAHLLHPAPSKKTQLFRPINVSNSLTPPQIYDPSSILSRLIRLNPCQHVSKTKESKNLALEAVVMKDKTTPRSASSFVPRSIRLDPC